MSELRDLPEAGGGLWRDVTVVVTLNQLMQLDSTKRALLLEALVAITAASAAIRLMPFRKVVQLAGNRQLGTELAKPAEMASAIRQARWAVGAVADRVPWRTVCFQRGLALHWMMRRRGLPSLLHYGVAHDPEKKLSAHVWLSCGGETVLGGEEAAKFTCLATFPASALS